MKYIPEEQAGTVYKLPVLELTRRNLTILLEKLDDPASLRTIIDPDNKIAVKAVEDQEHYSEREPGEMYMPTTQEFK